jgi:hypothetical protein
MDTSTVKLSRASRWLLKALPIGALALALTGCETLDPSSEAEPPSANAEIKSPSPTTNAVVQTAPAPKPVPAPRPLPAPKATESRPPAPPPPPSTPPPLAHVPDPTTVSAGKKGAESLISPKAPAPVHVAEHPPTPLQSSAQTASAAPENHVTQTAIAVVEPPQGSLIVKGPPRPIQQVSGGHGLLWLGFVFSLICLGSGVLLLAKRRAVGIGFSAGQAMPPKLGEHDLKMPLNPESGPAALVEDS